MNADGAWNTTVVEDRRDGSVVRQLVLPVVFVAAAALVGWLLLLLIKGIVVVVTYALGGALIVVPLVMARRLVGDRTGRERWRRVSTIAATVLLGVALLAVAHLLSLHGWLLIVIPAALVGLDRVVDAVSGWRERRAVRA